MSTWVKTFFDNTQKARENALAFVCGDAMLFTFIGVPPEFAHLGWKIISTVLLAVAGGIAGMVGKDLYVVIKKWIKQKFS